MTEKVDVLIVGAGLSVRVLEARSRVGGRMLSSTRANGSVSHHRFAALLDELALERFASPYGDRGVFH